MTVLTMVVGELDYLDAFGFSYQVVDGDDPGVYRTHLRASLIIWIPFVILIPLVLNNMLVRGLCSPYTVQDIRLPCSNDFKVTGYSLLINYS